MTSHKGKYIYIHCNRRIRVLLDEEGRIEDLYIDDQKFIPNGSEVSLELVAAEKKRSLYKDYFKKQFKNILLFSGAGSSIGIGKNGKVGMSMKELWNEAETMIGKEVFNKLCTYVYVDCPVIKPNLETLLSLIDGNIKYSKGTNNSATDDWVDLEGIKRKLLELIRDKCDLTAPDETNDFPHVQFISKITQRKATLPRVKIFTLNYDLLFEQAANRAGAVLLDGFSFTTPRTFSGRFFDYDIVQREKSRLKDEDNFISRLLHLYKLHGSLNWHQETYSKERVIIKERTENPLLVYPRESKYENSYEQPFFEMMARFQQNLRLDNTLLLCVGYSFSDKHINAVIEEALNQNPGFQLAVVNPNFDNPESENFKVLVKEALRSERVLLIDERFRDFVLHFPEIQTYNNESDIPAVNLK